MGRRNVVKVDYSKFDNGNGNSDEDDDFQEGTPPQKTNAKKLQKDLKKSETLKETKRKTRTSNADLLYQKDIITAISVSVGEKTEKNSVSVVEKAEKNKNVAKNTKRKKTFVISDDEDIPDTLPVEEKFKKSKKDEEKDVNEKVEKEEKDVNEEEEVKDDILTTSGNLIVSRLQENEVESDENNELSTKQSLNRKSNKVKGKSINVLKKETSVKPSVPVTEQRCSLTDKVQISGRLRIGLSRNLRVTKPLHPGVNPNV